jgi:hypothetical protein
MAKNLMDVNELSERLRVAKGTLYNWVSQARHGRGPFENGEGRLFKKIGRCLRFDWDQIEVDLQWDRPARGEGA